MARFYHIKPLGFAGDRDRLQPVAAARRRVRKHGARHGAGLKFQAVTRFAAGAAEAAPARAETNVTV